MWPKLDAAIAEAVDGAAIAPEPQRSAADMLVEVVDGLRRMERRMDEEQRMVEDPVGFAYNEQLASSKRITRSRSKSPFGHMLDRLQDLTRDKERVEWMLKDLSEREAYLKDRIYES
jgi:hypothetical protein